MRRTPTARTRFSPGERYGRVYQINYLRCILCGLCIEACPTRALTMTNEYELADDNRADLIYEKSDLLAPLLPGMEQPPHAMRLGDDEGDYYRGMFSPRRTDEPTEAEGDDVIAFWILAPIMVAAALGILFVRKAVHAALLLAVVMIGLAVLYAVQDAPFLFAVQIIVYTGAILMLFLFVLMLVGVDASDSVVETIRGQRLMAAVTRPGLRRAARARRRPGRPRRRDRARRGQQDGNVQGLAQLLFSKYIFAFEATSALLITAAHRRDGARPPRAARPRSPPRPTWPPSGCATTPSTARPSGRCPRPGVYARHNAVDTPALLPDGSPSELSVSRTLTARGNARTVSARDVGVLSGSLEAGAPDAGARPAPDDEEARS